MGIGLPAALNYAIMNTLLQTALARREQMEKIKEHLQQLELRREQTISSLKKAESAILKNSSPVSRFIQSIGRNLKAGEHHTAEANRERDHQLLLEYRKLENELELLHFEKEVLEEQLQDLPGIEREINHLKNIREKQLINGNDDCAVTLRGIHQQQDGLQDLRRILQEVIIEGSRLANQLLQISRSIQKLNGIGSLHQDHFIRENHETVSGYVFLDRLKRKALTVGQLFPKYDAAIFELYRLYRQQLPEAPERFFRYGPVYFNSLLYRAELQDNFLQTHLDVLELWKKITASVNLFKGKLAQIMYQLHYLEGKKERLLEKV